MTEQNDNPGPEQTETPAPPADSTIPKKGSGVAAGYTGEPSTFEPEEDGAADDAAAADDAPAGADAAPSGGSGPRSTEATGLSGEDRSIFQSHWDEFPGHID